MANVAIKNKIRDSSVQESISGLQVKETWLIENLDPASPSPLFDALNCPGVPVYGQGHTYVPDVVISSRIPRAFLDKARTQCLVDITWARAQFYTPTDAPRVRFTAFNREADTSYDRDRNIILVNYKPKGTGTMAFPSRSVVGRARGYKAMGTLEFDWVRSSDPSYLLGYFNTMNNAPWRAGAAYTWHMADLTIEKQAYQPWWNIHAGFLYDTQTFIQTVSYLDNDGNIPYDIDPYDITLQRGNGWTNTKQLQETNFTTLALPTGFQT